MGSAKLLNLERLLARLRTIPDVVQVAVASQLADEVEQLTEAMQRAAPDDPATPGDRIAEHIRFYPNPDRPLSYRIISDAKDDDGQPIAAHVEQGHRAKDGTHVPAQPSFFPTYRARKRGMQRRLKAAGRKAIKSFLKG